MTSSANTPLKVYLPNQSIKINRIEGSDLKNKKCDGFNRIPLCVILDACDMLLLPMANIFNEIYRTCKIPEQWKVAKIILE